MLIKIILSGDQFTALTQVAAKVTPAPKGYVWRNAAGGCFPETRLVTVKRSEQLHSGSWNVVIEVDVHQTLCVPNGNPEQLFSLAVPRAEFDDLFEALGVFPEGVDIKF